MTHLDLSKPVQTDRDEPVRLLCADMQARDGGRIVGLVRVFLHACDRLCRWHADGSPVVPGDPRLVNVPEPERTVWVVVYDDDSAQGWHDREKATAIAGTKGKRFSQVVDGPFPLTYRPGQGIEG